MTISTANAAPAKRFFVDMLIRDIELRDAILDLLDNCVDGAMRSNRNKEVSPSRPYENYKAEIDFNGGGFSITDNCGGIPLKLAEDYAFRMGRANGERDEHLPTVGIYGIGMKRAIFKLGRNATVTSQTSENGFAVKILPEWLSDDNDWNLGLDIDSAPLGFEGTRIEVTELREGIPRLLANETDFVTDLRVAIATYYSYIIDKGFTVRVNGSAVEPQRIALLLDEERGLRGGGVAPYVYNYESDGVRVDLAVGMYRNLPTDEEEEAALDRPSTETAGWTIICNDRVVVYADKTRMTGWGEASVPQYHTQFVSIAGVVIFRSDDPSKLPLTTTKRGVDGNSDLYLSVKDYMREGLKLFTDFTNKWKRSPVERQELQTRATSIAPESIEALVPDDRWAQVRRTSDGQSRGRRFKPSLPLPKEDDPMKQIRFTRLQSDIAKVAEYLFDDRSKAPSEVGAKCFDDVLQKVSR